MSGVKRQRLDGMGGPGMGGSAWASAGPGDGYGYDGGLMLMNPGAMGMQGMGMVPGGFAGAMMPGAFAGGPMGGIGGMPYGGETFDVFPCVKLRGLPFHVGEHDIRGFLGLETVDIVMVQRGGRFSGEAYVLLGNPLQLEVAVQKNRQHIGKRYVEVFPVRKLDYYRAVNQLMGDEAQVAALQAGAGSGSAEGGRGAGAGEGGRGGGGGGSGGGGGGGGVNPQHMMGGRAPAGMLGGGGGGGAAGGGSYMAAGPATAPAMGGSMMPYGGGGGGMMPPGGGGGMPPAGPPPGRGPRSGPPAAGLMGGPMGGPDGGGGRGGGYDAGGPAAAAAAGSNIVNNVLKLRGLPFSASAAEVAAWFAAGGLPIAQLSADNVRLITNREGRATGQAFVEFPTQAEAEAGLAMDRQMMGNRYVEIFTVTRDEYLRVTNGAGY